MWDVSMMAKMCKCIFGSFSLFFVQFIAMFRVVCVFSEKRSTELRLFDRVFVFVWFLLEEVNSIALTGFDGDTYLRSIVLMRLTHCVRPPLVNLYRERTAQCPEKYNTLFVGAPLGRPLSMRQTKQKNLLPSCLDAINLSNACFSLCLFVFFFSL